MQEEYINPYVKLMDWFQDNNCEVSLTKCNKYIGTNRSVIGTIVDNDGNHYLASGSDEITVIKKLKDMFEGNYKKP